MNAPQTRQNGGTRNQPPPKADSKPLPIDMTINDVVGQAVSGAISLEQAVGTINMHIEHMVEARLARRVAQAGSDDYPRWLYHEHYKSGVLVNDEKGLEALAAGDWYTNPAHIGDLDQAHLEIA